MVGGQGRLGLCGRPGGVGLAFGCGEASARGHADYRRLAVVAWLQGELRVVGERPAFIPGSVMPQCSVAKMLRLAASHRPSVA